MGRSLVTTVSPSTIISEIKENEKENKESALHEPDLFFNYFFPVQQATSGIGHRVEFFFRIGNQQCGKQKVLSC